jgi:predicted transposase/invertase (TIGR01784 family)
LAAFKHKFNRPPYLQKMPEKPRKKHDSILKAAFQEYFADLLRFFFPDADTLFDWSKGYSFLDKELLELSPDLNQKGGTRHVDLLAKIFLHDGTENWLLLHCEIQNSTDQNFSLRMFEYNYRLFDRYKTPIVSLAIFTGKKSQLRPQAYKTNVLGTSITFDYKSYQIFDHTEEELIAIGSPFSLVILTLQQEILNQKNSEQTKNNSRIKILKALWASNQYDEDVKRRFIVFLNNLFYIENTELNIKFDQALQTLTGGKITMGIIETAQEIAREEGIEKGIKKNKLEVAQTMKSYGYPAEDITKITGLSLKEIEAINIDVPPKAAK